MERLRYSSISVNKRWIINEIILGLKYCCRLPPAMLLPLLCTDSASLHNYSVIYSSDGP